MSKEALPLKDRILRELYMLTGMVCKDVDYLYYQLLKDGSFFTPVENNEVIHSEQSVDDFESWFEGL